MRAWKQVGQREQNSARDVGRCLLQTRLYGWKPLGVAANEENKQEQRLTGKGTGLTENSVEPLPWLGFPTGLNTGKRETYFLYHKSWTLRTSISRRKRDKELGSRKRKMGQRSGGWFFQPVFLTRHWFWFQPFPDDKPSSLCFLQTRNQPTGLIISQPRELYPPLLDLVLLMKLSGV